MRIPVRTGRNGSRRAASSWPHPAIRERVTELVQSGADSCLYRPERLIQLRRHFCVGQFREERRLNRLSLVRCQNSQGVTERLALLLERDEIVGAGPAIWGRGISGFRLDAFLALIEPQPIDRARARLVHNPSKNGPVRLLVARGPTPDVVKHV